MSGPTISLLAPSPGGAFSLLDLLWRATCAPYLTSLRATFAPHYTSLPATLVLRRKVRRDSERAIGLSSAPISRQLDDGC